MAASEAFAAALGEMRDANVLGAHIITAEVESERRRGRDQVTIAVAVTVSAAGTAFTAAWDTFGEAAAADPGGWDLAAASAEVAPAAALRGELIRASERGTPIRHRPDMTWRGAIAPAVAAGCTRFRS
jgi:hypothetical protein